MQLRAIIYHPTAFPETVRTSAQPLIRFNLPLFFPQLYQDALASVDPESQTRIKRFYRREDACRMYPNSCRLLQPRSQLY